MLLLFVGNGCAALIHALVWFRLLQIAGNSPTASTALLCGFGLGGAFLGGLGFERMFSTRRRHPCVVYAFLEAAIGILAVLALFLIPHLTGITAAVLLLPPAALIGAALSASANSRIDDGYGANIAGGVVGCFLAGFYLLRVYDLAVATYAAAAINIAVASISFALKRNAYSVEEGEATEDEIRSRPVGVLVAYVALSLIAVCALGADIVWTRLLSVILGATVYTSFIIQAVFLTALSAGAIAGGIFARKTPRPATAFAVSQICAAGGLAWAAYMLTGSLPFWPIDPWLAVNPWSIFELDVLRVGWAIFPATLLWGAGFSFAHAMLRRSGRNHGLIAGTAVAVNLLGAALGGLIFSALLPAFGALRTQQALIWLSVAAALAGFAQSRYEEPDFGWKKTARMAAAAVLALSLVATISDVPWQAIAYGRRIMTVIRSAQLDAGEANPVEILYKGDGANSSMLITQERGQRILYVDGKTKASNAREDLRIQTLVGTLPAFIHGNPQTAMLVGFGTGITAGALLRYPGVQEIEILDQEPALARATATMFQHENYGVLDDSRATILKDNARHHLLTTGKKFDLIISDAAQLWAADSSVTYSREYFELARRHLTTTGIVAQWLPLYDTDPATIRTALATFFDVFPDATIWSNNLGGQGYDLILLGQATPAGINVDGLQEQMDRPDHAMLSELLHQIGFNSAVEILATFTGRAPDLGSWLSDAPIDTDLNDRLEYLGGMGLNSMQYPQIHHDLLSYRRFPENLITGSEGRMRALRILLR